MHVSSRVNSSMLQRGVAIVELICFLLYMAIADWLCSVIVWCDVM